MGKPTGFIELKRSKQPARARIVLAFGGWRREMQHRERRRPQPAERTAIVEIADERNDAMRAELAHVVTIAGKADQACAIAQAVGNAQRDIAASHDQYARHRAARLARDPAQERSMLKSNQPR